MEGTSSSKGRKEGALGLGKVSREVLRRSVLQYLPQTGGITLDGGWMMLKGRTAVAHSPSIGVPVESIGFFAFHYAAANIACLFARPRHLVTGIYLPLGTSEEDLRTIVKGLGGEAKKYSVTVAAGQTAVYRGLEIPLVSTTCLGDTIGQPSLPAEGDVVLVVGAVGGEALWLKDLSEGKANDRWRSLTPLPAALRFQEIEGVKLMHDISEGGVKGALREVTEALDIRVDVSSDSIKYETGVDRLGQDQLKAPTYGALIAIVDPQRIDDLLKICEHDGYPCSTAGVVKQGKGAFVDGLRVDKFERTALDELYGTLQPGDEVIDGLREAYKVVEEHPEISKLVPEVGTNIVYAKPNTSSSRDVAALSGRIIKIDDNAKVCGEVIYGGSRFMASVVLAALEQKPQARSAANIRGGRDILDALTKMGIKVCTIQSAYGEEACPVASFIKNAGELFDAYLHPGGFGLEPSTTLIGETPEKLVNILIELARRV